jgi:hypothetical protein
MKSTQIRRLFELTTRQMRCKHAITGAAPASKMCAYCYDCTRCPYDQMLEDMEGAYPINPQTVQVTRVAC